MTREAYTQSSLSRMVSKTVIARLLSWRQLQARWRSIHCLHVFINRNYGLQKNSIIMLEQIRTIDKSRLLEYIGHLDCRDTKEVDASLKFSLDMGPETGWIFWDGRKRQGLVVI